MLHILCKERAFFYDRLWWCTVQPCSILHLKATWSIMLLISNGKSLTHHYILCHPVGWTLFNNICLCFSIRLCCINSLNISALSCPYTAAVQTASKCSFKSLEWLTLVKTALSYHARHGIILKKLKHYKHLFLWRSLKTGWIRSDTNTACMFSLCFIVN